MARYSKNLKFYLPEINDPNSIYVKGFVENFNVIDDKLNDIFSTTIAKDDLNYSEITAENRTNKRALTDLMASIWQSHIKKRKQSYGEELSLNITDDNNPHDTGISDMWIPEGYTNIAQTMIYQINNDINSTVNKNMIDWSIINSRQGNLNTIGSSKEQRLHSDLKIEYVNLAGYENSEDKNRKHVSDEQANKWENHVNTKSKTANPHNVSSQSLTSSTSNNTGGKAISEAINSPDNNVAIQWDKIDKNGSNISQITNRRHDDLQQINSLNYELKDSTKNKHISNKDGNDIFGHIFSKSENESSIKNIDNQGVENSIYSTAKINPHQVRAKDLWSDNTDSLNHGSQTIINEINNNNLSEKIIKGDKILWGMIDLNDKDGKRTKASIADFPLRNHQSLQDILGTDTSSTDTTKNKHISNKEHKDIISHIENSDNPHNVTAFQIAGNNIVDEINTSRTTSKINKNKINFTNINITDIPNRNHNDLLQIAVLDSSSGDTSKDKHLSNAQAKKWEDHANTVDKSNSNPHNVSAQNLKSSDGDEIGGVAIQKAINTQGSNLGINWSKVNKENSNLSEIKTRNHDDLQNIGRLDISSIDENKNKHVSNKQAKKWEDHVNTTDGSNPHNIKAVNLYDKNGVKSGGDAIIESVNENSSSNLIKWEKISKSNSDISDISVRSHQSLQEILPAESTSNSDKNKHISNNDFVNWENHRNNRNNPHNVKASHIGGTSIVNEINSISTVKIDKSKIDLSQYNITDIPTRNHDDLQNIKEVDVSNNDLSKNKHISNSQAKKWEDHTNTINSNPHRTRAKDISIDSIEGVNSSNIQSALEDLALKTTYNSSGLISDSSGSLIKTENSIIVRSNEFVLYHTTNMSGKLFNHTIPQKTFEISSLEKDRIGYIFAEYNITENNFNYNIAYDINFINFSNQLPLGIFYITDTSCKLISLSDYGNGTVEKISKKDLLLNKVEVESGLYLNHDSDISADNSEILNGDIKITSGIIWVGLERYNINELTLKGNKNPVIWYKTNDDGSWSTEQITSLKRNVIDTGNGIQEITNGDLFTSNWIYRDIYEDKWYMVLSGISYSQEKTVDMKIGYADAQPPSKLPNEIMEKSILVGKVITNKDEPVKNTAIYRTQGILFTNTSTGFMQIKTHNSLEEIQGGKSGEYYHLNLEQLNKLSSVETNADVTDNSNVGNCITSIIHDSTGENNVSIVDIYRNSKIGAENTLLKTGGTISGTIVSTAGIGLKIISDTYKDMTYHQRYGRVARTAMSVELVNGKHKGTYFIGLQNDNPDNSNIFLKKFTIQEDGIYEDTKKILNNSDPIMSSSTISIEGTSTFKKGSDKWKDSEILDNISIVLGQNNSIGGSIKLWGTSQDRYALIRSSNSDLFYDTKGKHYFNWDKTDVSGEILIGSGDGINNSNIKLLSSDKSYFSNGLRIGTNINSSGYIADFGGNINMNGQNIDSLNSISFINTGLKFMYQNINSGICLKTDSDSSSMLYFRKKDNTTKGSVGSIGEEFGLYAFSENKKILTSNLLNGTTSIYFDNIKKLDVLSTGINVVGNIQENGVDISSKYLSLSGGTISGALLLENDLPNKLILNRLSSGGNNNIEFKAPDYNSKYLGVHNGILRFGNSEDLASSGYKIYHEGNKPTTSDINAVNKNGDTINGALKTVSPLDQFVGIRGITTPPNLNNRLTETEMGWAYTGTRDYSSIENAFDMTSNANGILTFNTHVGLYGHQIGMSSNGAIYHRICTSGTWNSWSRLYEQNFKPTLDELGAMPTIGGTMTGQLTINSSSDASLIIKATTNEKPNYIQGVNLDGSVNFYFGKGTSGSDNIMIHSYKHSTGVVLESDRVKATKNLYVNSDKVYHQGFKPTAQDVGAISTDNGICSNLGYSGRVKVVPKIQSQNIQNGTNAYTYIKITFDSGWNSSMTSFDFKVRSYNKATDATISISCYTYAGNNGSWHGTRAYVNGYSAHEWKVYRGKNENGLPILVIYNPTGCDYANCGMFNILESNPNTYTITGHEGELPEGLDSMTTNYVYSSYNKPTSTDIGLENVKNWTASSLISANSTEEYATTNMVAQVRAEKLSSSGGILTGIPEISMNSPYIYFKDTREGSASGRSFIGFGSEVNKFQIYNSGSDKVLEFHQNGNLTYNSENMFLGVNKDKRVYHQGFKPTASDIGAVPMFASAPFLGLHRDGDNLHWYLEEGKYKSFWDNGNFNPNSKINKSGDTMTGILSITANDNALTIKTASSNSAIYILGKKHNDENEFFVGKGSYANSDISMHSYTYNNYIKLKTDRVECAKNLYVVNNKVYHEGFKPMVGNRTTLWSGNLDIGTFTLSATFENYDYLIFQTSAQDGASFGHYIMYKEELLPYKGSSSSFAINGGNWMLACRMSSDGRTFTSTYENCRMRKVIGGKI